MDSKEKAGDALRLFFRDFGVIERLTFDGYKEHSKTGTEFMKQIRTHSIDYHISKAHMHNRNQAEGVIRELRCKWYRTMIRRHAPIDLWK